jgi:hypothetical protein
MLCQATRLATGEEDNTSTTHVAHLRHARKHTCNAEARRNKDLIDKDRLTTPNPRSISTTQIPPLMLYHATRPTAGEEDNTSATPL